MTNKLHISVTLATIVTLVDVERSKGGLGLEFKSNSLTPLMMKDLNSEEIVPLLKDKGIIIKKYPISHREHIVKLSWT
jgi:hypothetical protein